MRDRFDFRALAAVALLLSAPAPPATAPPAQALPAQLETYVTKYVKLDPKARSDLFAGAPVTKLLDGDASKEVVVFGAVWVKAPIARYLAAVRDIERFESGGNFRVTKKVSSPPRAEDFAQLVLPQDDVDDLRSCKVSKCELKASQATIERLQREIDWTKPDAGERLNALARQLALGYVTSYLQGGNAELAVYRDAERPTFVAQEFAAMIDALPSIGEFLPQVRRYLLDYPKASLPNSESFIYWQEAKFGLKPTIRVNHVVMTEEASGAMIASKMLYASHYFWTALELRVLVRDPPRGAGFWLVTESRSRSDGLSGFVGRMIRGKVRGEAEKGTAAVLEVTRSQMEGR